MTDKTLPIIVIIVTLCFLVLYLYVLSGYGDSPEVYCWTDLMGERICRIMPKIELDKKPEVKPPITYDGVRVIVPPRGTAKCPKGDLCV